MVDTTQALLNYQTAGTVGAITETTQATFTPQTLVSECVANLRQQVQNEFVTYAYVVNEDGILIGVVVLRELLFASPSQRLAEIMLENPFALVATCSVIEAMRQVLKKHYPVYPVCDENGKFLGTLRGAKLFEEQAVELSAQAGSMVGVEKEERMTTPWPQSLKFRHPWLQLNLLTAFLAGGVVGAFDDTINRIVILASFLPVLAGQSGNTGSQALAVTLRGMTLGDYDGGPASGLLRKEAILGMSNGFGVGIIAAIGMYLMASWQHNPDALGLSLVVLCAMTVSCMLSGISGVLVPLGLKRFGFDPVTASSIFLSTATDIASMGLLLTLAAVCI